MHILVSSKQKMLKSHIESHPWVTEPKLVERFMKDFGYKNKATARTCVNRMLRKLELTGHIERKRLKQKEGGSIPTNIWRAKS